MPEQKFDPHRPSLFVIVPESTNSQIIRAGRSRKMTITDASIGYVRCQLPLPQGEGLGICQTNVLTNRLEEV